MRKVDLVKMIPIGKIVEGQDGAIYGKYLFRIDNRGDMTIYDIEKFGDCVTPEMKVDALKLDKAETVCPHSNAVCFGSEFYEEGDEFPLLYSNIYNNYMRTDRPLKGVCCVYRIVRDGEKFSTTLVQLIEIGFVEDASLWKMCEERDSERPFGNFCIDVDKNIYYGFTMREAVGGTRYFAFDLPKARDGELCEEFGVRKVVLNPEDIKSQFDCDNHWFLQGACCHNSLIYSLEGFYTDELPPRMRIIDPAEQKQILAVDLRRHGPSIEPEFIDFYGDVCYYSDELGNFYIMELEGDV